MNYLTGISERAQEWQKNLEGFQREVAVANSEPGQSVRDALPGVMRALKDLEAAVAAARQAAKDLETAARNATQGAGTT